MDIQRPSIAHAKKIRRIIYIGIAVVSIGGVTFGVSRLRPAAPSVDKGTIWTDEVKRGPKTSGGFPRGPIPAWILSFCSASLLRS